MTKQKYFIVLNVSQATMIIALYGVYITMYGWLELTSHHYSNLLSFDVGSLNYVCIRALFYTYDDLQLQPFYSYFAGCVSFTILMTSYIMLLFGNLMDSKFVVGSCLILSICRIIACMVLTIYVWNQELLNHLFHDNVVFVSEVTKAALQIMLEEYSVYVLYKRFKNLIGKFSITSDAKYTRFQDQKHLVSNMILEHS